MENDANQPATKQDLRKGLEAIAAQIQAAEGRATEAMRNMRTQIQAAEESGAEAMRNTQTQIQTAEERTTEAMRDMQTEILRGIEAFARGNFARMVRLETADATTTQRLAAIEERLL